MCQLSSLVIPLNMRQSVLDFEAPYSSYEHLVLKVNYRIVCEIDKCTFQRLICLSIYQPVIT